MPVAPLIMVQFSKFNFSLKVEIKPHQIICAILFREFVKIAKFAKLNRTQNFVDLQYHFFCRPFLCNICLKLFCSKKNLRLHMNAVHDPLTCIKCARKFNTRSEVIKHIDAVHKAGKLHPCQSCSRKFSSVGNLNVHVRQVHDKVRQFSCTEENCGKEFTKRSDLSRHVDSVHRKLKPWICILCQASFGLRFSLLTHMRRVHKMDNLDSLRIPNDDDRGESQMDVTSQDVQIQKSEIATELPMEETSVDSDDCILLDEIKDEPLSQSDKHFEILPEVTFHESEETQSDSHDPYVNQGETSETESQADLDLYVSNMIEKVKKDKAKQSFANSRLAGH